MKPGTDINIETLYQQVDDAFFRYDYAKALRILKDIQATEGPSTRALSLEASVRLEGHDFDGAQKALQELLRFAPTDAYGNYLQARLDYEAGKLRDVVRRIRPFLQEKNLTPNLKEKFWNLEGRARKKLGDGHASTEAYRQSAIYAPSTHIKALEWSNYLFNLHYEGMPTSKRLAVHKKYGAILRGVQPFWNRLLKPRKKIRVGYLSPNFREHVVLRFVLPFFEHFDEEKFEVYAYMLNYEDQESKHIMQTATMWRNLTRMDADMAARRIYDDGIDILVDFAGHSEGGKGLEIMARKPAPIQITGVGYFDMAGLPAVDYVLGDVYLDSIPAGVNNILNFTEKILALPHTHLCYVPKKNLPAVAPLPALKNGYITFGSFNNLAKVTDDVLKTWGQILQAVPHSRLYLKTSVLDHSLAIEKLKERLHKAQIDPERVILEGFSKNYMQDYAKVDLALDTFPYPGGGTSFDALYMGVPVLTLEGKSHGERFGVSILQNLGLAEFIAKNPTDYVTRAKLLTGDLNLLAALRKNMRALMQKTPLLDAKAYMKDVEAAYQEVLHIYEEQRKQKFSDKEGAEFSRAFLALAQKEDKLQILALADRLLLWGQAASNVQKLIAGVYLDADEVDNSCRALKEIQAKDTAEYYLLQGRLDIMTWHFEAAIQHLRKAVQIGLPKHLIATSHNFLARAYATLGNIEDAFQQHLVAYHEAEFLNERISTLSNCLFFLHYVERDSAYRLSFARAFNDLLKNTKSVPLRKERSRDGRIRVGYISSSFDFHVIANFCHALFEKHDRGRFTVYGYSLSSENEIAQSFQDYADGFFYLGGKTAKEIAQRIAADGIDILFDLAGHDAKGAMPVLAYKPAPIIISGIGYMSTTGLGTVDYFLGDVYADPIGLHDADFTEKLLRLPHSHFCWRNSKKPHIPVANPPCLKNDNITFGSFNNYAKVNDKVLAVWAKILQRIPTAKLFLKTFSFGHDSKDGERSALRRLAKFGIGEERIIFEGFSGDYLQAYKKIDIALDPFPYPGGGTTLDALYMGVPVITLSGATHNARFGTSILMNLGLQDLCANSEAEYIEKAVALAEDKERLLDLRKTLRWRMKKSPLMDESFYMADMEALFEKIWAQKAQELGIAANFEDLVKQAQVAMRDADWRTVANLAAQAIPLGEVPLWLLEGTGFAWIQLGDMSRARHYLLLALKRDPQRAEVLYQLADAAKQALDFPQAVTWATKALALTEETKATRAFRCRLWGLKAYAERQISLDASASYLQASVLAAGDEKRRYYSAYLLVLHDKEIHGQEEIFEASCGYEKMCADIQPLPPVKYAHKKIRVGYLSPDFRRHVMFAFIYPLFAAHNREKFELYAYNLTKDTDGFTEALQAQADHWRDMAGKSMAEIAQQIRTDEIDVVFDLAGHSSGNALPALVYRPAPVALSGLGYLGTTGLRAVDAFVTDGIVNPIQQKTYLVEKPLRLTSQFCYAGREELKASQGAPCKEAGYITFGAYNSYHKITEETLFLWREILLRVPQSRLLIKCQPFVAPNNALAAYARLKKAGLPMERIDFEPADDRYMERALSVDIGLDTYPYPGGGTTFDLLYMGVPVVTRYGSSRLSRFGLSILTQVGLEDLAAPDGSSYVEKTVALANDVELLDVLHKNLRSMLQKSPAMDAKRYLQELEAFYQKSLAEVQKRG